MLPYTHILVLQETRGQAHDLAEFHTLHPSHIAIGSFCRGGRSGGLVFALRRDFAAQFRSVTIEPVVTGRIAILHLDADEYRLDVVGIHLVSTGGESIPRQLARLATRIDPLGRTSTIVIGDANFVDPTEGRLDTSSGTVVADRGELQKAFDELFPSFCEVPAPGYSRRQFREGEVSLLARIDRVWLNLPTAMLRQCHAQSHYSSSPLDPLLPSDHAALLLRLQAPSQHTGGKRPIPRWVTEHEDFTAIAHDMLGEVASSTGDCWSKLRAASEAMRRAAKEVQRRAAAPGPHLAASWQAHRLTTAHREWRRRNRQGVMKSVGELPDLLSLFVLADGGLRSELDVPAYVAAFQQLMLRATLEEMQLDLKRTDVDEKRRAIRARADRQLASWSPRNRRFASIVVLSAEGGRALGCDEAGAALQAHWAPVFEGSRGMDRALAAPFLDSVVPTQRYIAPLDYEHFCMCLRHCPHSAPGPDGVTYSAWSHSVERGANILFGCYAALTSGSQPPEEFNAAYLVFVPKASPEHVGPVMSAAPAGYRPISLSNTSQKLIARAISQALEDYAAELVHPMQRGFVPGRSLVDSVLDLEAEMAIGSAHGAPRQAVVLFDFSAAFPSAEWEWISAALEAQGLPEWLRHAVFGLLYGSTAKVKFGGKVHSGLIRIARGIKQGCPTSGILWALLLDPVVRRLCSVAERIPASLSFFADDLSSGMRDAVRGLNLLLPELRALEGAAGLRLNIGKTRVVNFGTVDDVRLRRLLRAGLRMEGVHVVKYATCLGYVIGPEAGPKRWDKTHQKFQSRVAHVKSLAVHLRDRVRAYRSLAFSTLTYRAQLVSPSPALLRSEAAAISSVMAAPMYALPPPLAARLGALGCAFSTPDLATTAKAAQVRVALTHERLHLHIRRIEGARTEDDALLDWRRPEWMTGSALELLEAALELVNSLPREVRDSASVQKSVYAHLIALHDVRPVVGIVQRRLRYFIPGATMDDAIVVVTNLRVVFAALPAYIGIAALRTVANGWMTTRRLAHGAEGCKLGCLAVGGDSLEHCFGCPGFAQAARSTGLHRPSWYEAGLGRDVLMMRFWPEDQILRDVIWTYLLYCVYNQSRHGERAFSLEDGVAALRAQVRSLATRSQRAAVILGLL